MLTLMALLQQLTSADMNKHFLLDWQTTRNGHTPDKQILNFHKVEHSDVKKWLVYPFSAMQNAISSPLFQAPTFQLLSHSNMKRLLGSLRNTASLMLNSRSVAYNKAIVLSRKYISILS